MQVLPAYAITDARLASSTAPEADYAAWVSGSLYAVGARCIRTATHRIYECTVAGAGTVAPESDPASWTDVGPTNRWAMFDEALGSRTILTSPLTVSLTLGAFSDLVLLNVTGSTVTLSGAVSRTVSVPAEVVSGAGSTVLIQGLSSAGGTLTVSITGTGTVACGTLAVGTFFTLGSTSGGINFDMRDYSRKSFDAYGNATVTRRPVSRLIDTKFSAPLTAMDQCDRVLTALRSRNVVWMGVSWLSSSIVYGMVTKWGLRRGQKSMTGSTSIQGLAFGL